MSRSLEKYLSSWQSIPSLDGYAPPAPIDPDQSVYEESFDTPAGELAIVASELHRTVVVDRERIPILKGITLEVHRGETVFFIGPSGSGKTTLLSLLGCILTPEQGDLSVLGREVSRLGPTSLTAFRREHLGFIFQNFNLMPTLSAVDNVRLAFAIRGFSSFEARTKAMELLDRVGIAHRARVRPGRLSTGECQRVAVARALAGEPDIILADEPTASLDAENGHAIMQLLVNLVHDHGTTLLIVTHDNRIMSFADRILRIEDGRIAGDDRPTGSRWANLRAETVTALIGE